MPPSQRLQKRFGVILPGREYTGARAKLHLTNPPRSALLPEKLHDLMKKKVFEATFPLHEVRLSTRVPGRKSHERWRSKTGWGKIFG